MSAARQHPFPVSGRRPQRESDLRNQDRPGIYSIFKPLDANEALPREQLLAARQFRTLGRWEVAGAIWFPLLVAILILDQWADVPAPIGLSAVGLTFVALLAFALKADRILRRRGQEGPSGKFADE